jgi:hypothetical protein
LMIILVPAFGKFLSSCSVHIGMYNLCYIRTTRTHTHTQNESGHVQSPTTLEFSPASQRAHIPCSFPSSSAFFRMYLPPPTRTNKHRQNRANGVGQAGEQEVQEVHLACCSSYIFFFPRRITIHRSAAPTLCFIMHTYFYLFFYFVLWAFMVREGGFQHRIIVERGK